jgi:hypothetical protein
MFRLGAPKQRVKDEVTGGIQLAGYGDALLGCDDLVCASSAQLVDRIDRWVPLVHQAAVGVMGPVLEEGQRNGEVRSDLSLDELVDFLVEQTYLAAEEIDRSEEAVRKRFRHFVAPALEARGGSGGEIVSRTREVEDAIAAAVEALQNLAGQLHRGG